MKRKYYLLTVTQTGPDLNPGSHFITHGIRHLIKLADPEGLVFEMSLFSDYPNHWRAVFAQADAVFLCGNPRYDRSNHPHWWVTGVWERFSEARKRGILTGDLYAGAASPLPLEPANDDAKKLLSYERNRKTAQAARLLDLVVCRDQTSWIIAKAQNPEARLLPCSTWWAKDWLNVTPGVPMHSAVIIPSLNANPTGIRALVARRHLLPANRPVYLVAHCAVEFLLLKELFPSDPRVICLSDPLSLMQFLANCSHIISARLHASIPALSLGVKVLPVAVDNRAQALSLFGVTPVPYTSILSGNFSDRFFSGSQVTTPNTDEFVSLFRKKIVSQIKKPRGAL